MRGTVALAAALALPTRLDGGAAFPHRDLVVVIVFGVVFGTLVVQGLSLRPLLLHLRLGDDGTVDREARLARVEALRSAAAATQIPRGAGAADLVRKSYALQLERAEDDIAVLHAALRGQQQRLLALRADGTTGGAAFQQLEEELDWMELG
jgi:CPA1 family monovalent cation:H+ antiporter